jgi:imidazolonepropionase-like amidohydrolase
MPGSGIFVELFGFTPMEVIVAATRHGADLMQNGGDRPDPPAISPTGLLDGDPLADIRIFQDPERILGVMRRQFAGA